MKHKSWIAFSGFVWFFIGTFLLYKGINLITDAMMIGIGLLIGYFKGQFILSKTAKRVVARISSLSLPIQMKDVYSPAYYILIGSMMALGMLFKFLPISANVHGTIDIAIGAALIKGSTFYFLAIYGSRFPAQSP
jgi:hypothetical protein